MVYGGRIDVSCKFLKCKNILNKLNKKLNVFSVLIKFKNKPCRTLSYA